MNSFEWILAGTIYSLTGVGIYYSLTQNSFEWILVAIMCGIMFSIFFYLNKKADKYQRDVEEIQKEIDKALGAKH